MPDGYEVHGNSVRIYFRYQGKLCKEKIGPADPATIQHAKHLAGLINYEIKAGCFYYAKHFPNSKNVVDNTFGHWSEKWLTIRENQVAASTLRAERSKFAVHILPKWQDYQMQSIPHVDIQVWISSELASLHNKTIKEIISLMSRVFDLYSTQYQYLNPTKGIKVRLPDSEDPDPFTLDEIRALTSVATHRKQEQALIKFMLWDGCRVSEAIALAWEDVVDFENGIISYQHAKVVGQYKVTKTRRSTRTHKLLKPAREALHSQWALTGGLEPITVEITQRDNKTRKKKKIRPIFRRTSGKPYNFDFVLRDRFFKGHCKLAGVRYRPPSQCRHTFISQMLTLGVIPLHWIAAHVGHSNIETIQKHYGKWIVNDGPDVQRTVERLLDL